MRTYPVNRPERRHFPRTRAGVLAALSVLLAAGCTEQPTEPDSDPSAVTPALAAARQAHGAGIDAEFAAIARDQPGFGGMYFDDTGRLNVYVTNQVRSPQAQMRLMMRVNASLRAQGRVGTAGNVMFRSATRDYAELTTLRARMRPVLQQPGVVFTDIDESQNRLRIGVLEGTSAAQIESVLGSLDVPLDAVSIETTEPIIPVDMLGHAHDPVAGGLQIWRFIPPGSAGICTLGFNVRFTTPAKSQHYFFTNSHCTAVSGAVDGTEWRQGPLSLATRTVAVEVADPPFFACQYVGFRCRFSDAALARYNEGIPAELSLIYQTATSGTTAAATVDLNPDGQSFLIARERPFPLMGDILNKVGRTSGWTRGPVTATCIDTGVFGSTPPIAMLCQDQVQAFVAGGDSGSPVFEQIGGWHPVTLVGILWGASPTTFTFSAMENIHFEFGDFLVKGR